MKFSPSMRSQKGFSLVELMIVVGIIGILATLALPRFKQFQAKAKLGEAKNILTHLYTLEQTYSLDNNAFIAFNAPLGAIPGASVGSTCAVVGGAQSIGFQLDPCGVATSPVPRFQYNVAVGANTAQFLASATTGAAQFNRVCPGNNAFAVTISETNNIVEQTIGVLCPN